MILNDWEKSPPSLLSFYTSSYKPRVNKHIVQILALSSVLVSISGVEIALRHEGRPWSEVAAVRSHGPTQGCTSNVRHLAVVLHSSFLSIKIIHQLLPVGYNTQDGSHLIITRTDTYENSTIIYNTIHRAESFYTIKRRVYVFVCTFALSSLLLTNRLAQAPKIRIDYSVIFLWSIEHNFYFLRFVIQKLRVF